MSDSDRTLAAYEAHADRYAERSTTRVSPAVAQLIDLLPAGAQVLELGSGTGIEADALEAGGLAVERTDGAHSFVDRLRGRRVAARLLDIRAADYGGPYDAIYASAVLLHLSREELPGALEVARTAVRQGGLILASFKEGESAGWSTAKLEVPRHFTYWTSEPLRTAFEAAGWKQVEITLSGDVDTGRWLTVLAYRDGRSGARGLTHA